MVKKTLLNSVSFRVLFQHATLFFLAFVIVLTTFYDDAEARRRRRPKKKRAKIINEKKLFERIGGTKAVGEIVDEWVRLNLADSRLSASFKETTSSPDRLKKFRMSLNDQLCELADGPCRYRGADMKKAHAGMKISEAQFLAFAENLFRSMRKFNISEREKNEMLGRVGELKSEMLETPSST